MSNVIKSKVCITSAAIILVAGLIYAIYKRKKRLRDATGALNYLIIKVATTEKETDEIILELRRSCNEYKAIGFDCEWVTEEHKRRPVALIQLSSYNGYCGLFRLSHMKDMPQSLKDLLEDRSIYKVGVAPNGDANYLFNDYSVRLESTLDLRHIAELCECPPGGLAALAKSQLSIVLDKSWRVRCSNWEADELSAKQINYAAIDAHVAIKILVHLVRVYTKHDRTAHFLSNMEFLCEQCANISFKAKQSVVKLSNRTTKEDLQRLSRPPRVYRHMTRSKPLYNNCFLEAPDGEMLCTCDAKKAFWYIEKQLADKVKDEPLTVRLRFEPSGRSVGDVGRYYQLVKENKCVVCGQTNSYIRKNVVPREYRKYFPDIMKEHSSHDVVLLCVSCHQSSNMRDQRVRERLAAECGAPLASREHAIYEDAATKKVKSAGRALQYQSQKHVLPGSRRRELENIIKEYYMTDDVTPEILQQACNLQVVFENAEYEAHGQKVVDYFHRHEGGLLRLEELWREHFLTSMQPRYMPHLWSVKHNEERLRVKLQEGRLSREDLKLVGFVNCF